MWHCRQAVICLINIFKRGTMMALIIISPLLKHLEAFSSLSLFDCRSSKTQPNAASAMPLRLHARRKAQSRSPQRRPRPRWSAGLFLYFCATGVCVCLYFYRIFVFIVEESEIGLGSRPTDSKFIPMITRQRFIHCAIFLLHSKKKYFKFFLFNSVRFG